jgi:hypothetical protein
MVRGVNRVPGAAVDCYSEEFARKVGRRSKEVLGNQANRKNNLGLFMVRNFMVCNFSQLYLLFNKLINQNDDFLTKLTF